MPASLEINLNLQPLTLSEGFTQSEIGLLNECPLKWNLRYNNLLTRSGTFSWAMWVGTAWHSFQEIWRIEKGNIPMDKHYGQYEFSKDVLRDSEFECQLEYWSSVLPAYQQAYAKLYREEEKMEWMIVEQELSAEFMGFKLRGKLDLAHNKLRFIRDFKTTSSAWLISPNGWHFKLQFMFYCWLMWKNHPKWAAKQFDFQLDMMQKPNLKQTKADGTWQGHIRRVAQDIKDRPEFYLTRQTKLILPEQIAHFEKLVLGPTMERLSLVKENPEAAISVISTPNTNACNAFGNQCDFFTICEQGWDAGKFFFEQRTQKHQEL